MLDREMLLARGRERKLHSELEAAASGLRLRDQINAELRMREEQLVGRIHQQQVSRSPKGEIKGGGAFVVRCQRPS